MPSSVSVAQALLNQASAQNRTLNPMQLMNLVVLAEGWHLALSNGDSLLENNAQEQVTARVYGPVVPALLRKIRRYGTGPVPALSGAKPLEDPFHQQLVAKVYEIYGGFSPYELAYLNHHVGSPWEEVWNAPLGERLHRRSYMPVTAIMAHFAAKASNEASGLDRMMEPELPLHEPDFLTEGEIQDYLEEQADFLVRQERHQMEFTRRGFRWAWGVSLATLALLAGAGAGWIQLEGFVLATVGGTAFGGVMALLIAMSREIFRSRP